MFRVRIFAIVSAWSDQESCEQLPSLFYEKLHFVFSMTKQEGDKRGREKTIWGGNKGGSGL